MISIILPVYNVEKYLEKCLDSIISQDFKDIEIICVNDGSTDDSLTILEKYAMKDNRVKIITQQNKGLGSARNLGLKCAIGEYVWFIDSDDFISENSLNELHYNILSNESDIVLFKFNKFDGVENKYFPGGIPFYHLFGHVDYNNFTFSYKDMKIHVMNTFISVWSKLYKKEFLEKYDFHFPEGIAYEDVLFQIKTFLYAEKMSFSPQHIYNYRISNLNSIMNDSSKIFDIIKVVDSVEEFLKESSFFNEFQEEFLTFKITQLSQYITSSCGDKYFEEVKNEFILMNKEYNLNKLSKKHSAIFNKVINSNNLIEYLNN